MYAKPNTKPMTRADALTQALIDLIRIGSNESQYLAAAIAVGMDAREIDACRERAIDAVFH